MEAFQELINIADRLLGPGGCSWDQAQTLQTLQPYLLEETHELLEAIDLQDPIKIAEELGDVFYALIFISRLNRTPDLASSLRTICDKLIRRHPHVFASTKVSSNDDIVRNWEAIKKTEGKKHPLDNIPPTLPALSRAQKILSKLKKEPLAHEKLSNGIGQKLWDLVKEANLEAVDAETALRQTCLAYESAYKNK